MTREENHSPLFRDEVMRARQVQWLGSVRTRMRKRRPLSFAWVTGISLLLATALITFSIWGEVTRKAPSCRAYWSPPPACSI